MATVATQNPVVKSESKSSKKKKSKAQPVEASASENTPAESGFKENAPTETGSSDGTSDNAHIKELEKQIRNINKKITNASKVDNVVADNPGLSLDELVTARKINADQKAQILKKPALNAAIKQLEDQIVQYKKLLSEFNVSFAAEKAELVESLNASHKTQLEEKITAAKEEAAAAFQQKQETGLLLVSKFLQLAAQRRGEEHDPELDENKSIEALLHKVYLGNENAVSCMLKLVNGSEDTSSFQGERLTTTYADMKAAALAQPVLPIIDFEALELDDDEPAVETTEYPVQGDPTLVHAGLTELDEPTISMTNGTHKANLEIEGVPQNSTFGTGAANAAAETRWDEANDLSTSQEWVKVQPRDVAETETGTTATPAAENKQSWAEEVSVAPAETRDGADTSPPQPKQDDGFSEVKAARRGNGEYRGRGRGRGGRGRGRGGQGQPSGAQRGGRRSDESQS